MGKCGRRADKGRCILRIKAQKENGRAGAERGDGSEQSRQQILQPVHPVRNQIVAQPFDREIGIDNAHQYTDEEQQDQNLDRVVEEKVHSRAQGSSDTQPENPIDQPVCKILYHVTTCVFRFPEVSSRHFPWAPVPSSSPLHPRLRQEWS